MGGAETPGPGRLVAASHRTGRADSGFGSGRGVFLGGRPGSPSAGGGGGRLFLLLLFQAGEALVDVVT